MSLSSAISNALSGMRASSAAAEITGSNLANATNENYARRELIIQANAVGGQGGVEVVGVRRHANTVLASAWREANSMAALAEKNSQNAAAIQSLYGDPTQPGSLANRLTKFQGSLVSAASRPDLTERLGAAVDSLNGVVRSVNNIADGIQKQRQAADRQISSLADRMNEILSSLQDLNVRLPAATSQGQDVSTLLDHQDQLIDELSSIADLRVYQRDRGTLAIYSSGGAVLLDNKAAEISFDGTGSMTANLSLASGTLGALEINGDAVTVGETAGKLRGGEIGALFEFRDVTAVRQQAEIDSFAFELASRLNDPTIDPTRGPSEIGFLTDQGAVADTASLEGLGNRLRLNMAVDPNSGGDAALIRDGLNAVSSGPKGNAQLIISLSDKVTGQSLVGSGEFAGENIGLDTFAERLTGNVSYDMLRQEEAQVFAVTQSETLKSFRLDQAVDSDAELQNLMALEQAYAANAQVLRSVDEMMDTLLGIV